MNCIVKPSLVVTVVTVSPVMGPGWALSVIWRPTHVLSSLEAVAGRLAIGVVLLSEIGRGMLEGRLGVGAGLGSMAGQSPEIAKHGPNTAPLYVSFPPTIATFDVVVRCWAHVYSVWPSTATTHFRAAGGIVVVRIVPKAPLEAIGT